MKHNWIVTVAVVILFFVAQVTGLFIIDKYYLEETKESEWKSLPSVFGVDVERPDVAPAVSIWYMVLAIVLGTVLILFIVSMKKVFIWKLWFLLSVVLCLQIAFAAFFNDFWALALAVILGLWKVFLPNFVVHNMSELFIYGGLAVIFVPMLTPLYAVLLLVLLSVYDMYAVWKSKHMIKMAKFQAKSGIFAGFMLPYIQKEGKKSKTRTAVLGGGDIGFPLIFAGTILVSLGLLSSLIVALFSSFSLFLLLFFSKKDRFYPAMPFLTSGCLLGFLFVYLFI